MTLDEFRRTIFNSAPEDWHKIACGGEGPSYLDAFSSVTSYPGGVEEHWLQHDSHYYRATFRPDVSIGLAWGLAWGPLDDQRDFDWVKGMPDKSCHPVLVDLLSNGCLVDRYVGLVVDGGRARLPFPTGKYDSTADPSRPVLIEEQVTRDEVALWRIVDVLETGRQEFDSYLRRVGFVVL
ncbi:MAG: hypothetical protein ACLQQM_02775 [Acidimicrobiales bacterium]